ncbi:MAG: branched-chain amino acid ABC transporter ATP-binding protein/permease [Hydrogenophaga sp.]|nr:branched-chain amino acid ABC transporter ATP-binding protein/permease [Hydrogenophaga sp.]
MNARLRETLWVVAIAAALLAIVSQLGNDYYLRIAFTMCVYFICALGMNVLVGFAGLKSLGQAGLFAAGAYAAALFTSRWDFDPWLSFALAAVVAGGFGVLIALPSLRVKGPYLAMVTLAFGVVVEKIISEWTDVLGGAQGLYGIKPLTWNGAPLSSTQWVVFGILLGAVTHLLLRNLLRGRFGRALLSLSADEIASSSVGVRVYRAKVLAFTVAAVTCGMAGAMVAQQNQYINSDFITFHLSIFILLLVMFGGAGTVAGPLVGAVSLTLIDVLLARWPAAQHFVYGALLLFALYAMPGGVMGSVNQWLGKRSSTKARALAPSASVDLMFNSDGSGEMLSVNKICKAYGGVKTAQSVSFTLQRGHVHALIGPNGAGKTTMINMLTGIVAPDSGSICFEGREMAGLPVHATCIAGLGRTFQNLRLFGDLSVLDNVKLGRHARMKNGFLSSLLGLPSTYREEAVASERAFVLLQMVGLDHLADSPAGSLPYGLQRRVELARALATDPHLLLLDEPAAGLNPQETAELGDLLVRISRMGLTILMVEHHMDMVMRVSDHVIVLDYGVKIAEGTPAQIQSNNTVIEAYLGTDAHEAVAA